MKTRLLQWLECPRCQGDLRLDGGPDAAGEREVDEGALVCVRSGHRFAIRRGIPRFVEGDGYAGNFSFEWWRHRQTQVDRFSGRTISREKFQSQLDVPLEWLRGKLVLDVGCGSGRFMDVALASGAEVVGFDLSFAVDAARENLKEEPRAHFLQADVFALPFKQGVFDLVFSFGVLHHTPDCRRAFSRLPRLVKPGGTVSICLYSGYERILVYSGNWWRAVLNKLPPTLLYAVCHLAIPLYYVYRIPGIGQLGKIVWNIGMQPNWRLRVLDTYDWYSPTYQSAHTHYEVFQWFQDAGLTDVRILEPGISLLGHQPRGALRASPTAQTEPAVTEALRT